MEQFTDFQPLVWATASVPKKDAGAVFFFSNKRWVYLKFSAPKIFGIHDGFGPPNKLWVLRHVQILWQV